MSDAPTVAPGGLQEQLATVVARMPFVMTMHVVLAVLLVAGGSLWVIGGVMLWGSAPVGAALTLLEALVVMALAAVAIAEAVLLSQTRSALRPLAGSSGGDPSHAVRAFGRLRMFFQLEIGFVLGVIALILLNVVVALVTSTVPVVRPVP